MPASYPTSAKAYPSRSNGQVIDASHVVDLQLEVTAIETDLISGLPAARGGTGQTTLTANGVMVGNGTGAVQTVTGTGGQVVSFDASGVPVASDIPGGDLQVALTAQVFG